MLRALALVLVVLGVASGVPSRAPAVNRREIVRPHSAWLDRVAQCESGGRWHIATGNGFYGGLQFALSTWRGVGGRGMPHQASVLEQKYRAVRLLRVQGRGAWPVCGWR